MSVKSWTGETLAKGPEKCAEKFGEEAVGDHRGGQRRPGGADGAEAADVLYHLLVMLASRTCRLRTVLAELGAARGRGRGIAEKAGR